MAGVPQCVGIYNLPITAHAYIQLPGCLIHECLQGILIMREIKGAILCRDKLREVVQVSNPQGVNSTEQDEEGVDSIEKNCSL